VADEASTGPFTISFLPTTATSFSDINGAAFNIQSLNSGDITITSLSAVPERSSLFLMGLALSGIALNALPLLHRRFRIAGFSDPRR
jgi:hypothetical protein